MPMGNDIHTLMTTQHKLRSPNPLDRRGSLRLPLASAALAEWQIAMACSGSAIDRVTTDHLFRWK